MGRYRSVLSAVVCVASTAIAAQGIADTRFEEPTAAAPVADKATTSDTFIIYDAPAAAAPASAAAASQTLAVVPALVVPDVTVQCPIGLLQQAYDEATTGFQAATRYVTATEVLKLCEEHAKLFKRAIDNETQLLESYAAMLTAKEHVDVQRSGQGAAIAAPVTDAAQTSETDLQTGTAPSQPVAKDPSCPDPRPAAKFVLANVLGGPGGRDPKADIALYASWDQQAGYRETWMVRPGGMVEPGLTVTKIERGTGTMPYRVMIEDCAGPMELAWSTRERDYTDDPYDLNYTITDQATGEVRGRKATVYNLGN